MKDYKTLIFDLSRSQLKEVLVENGHKAFSADQVFKWLYEKHELNPDNWSNVSKSVKSFLQTEFDFSLPKIVWNGLSKDGTQKFLVAMRDEQSVETVAIPAKNNRLTLCVSSQVGCAIGCTFCHTATMGLKRHLTPGEVTGQFLAVQIFLKKQEKSLTNIVYMGQGEPLHNFDNMKIATEIFLDPFAFGLGQRKITLSTSGLVPQIEKLFDFPPINFAISLHAVRNDKRSELMPINKAYDLERLMTAIKKIPLKAHRHITYEYLLIDGFNDGPEDIDGLVNLLDKKESKVNIIPFNEYPESKYKRPAPMRVMWFMDQLIKRGLVATIRATKGDDILAACGQLKAVKGELNLRGPQIV